jgi:peptide/nickel transport system permease protein
MASYIIRRIIFAIITLFLISIISFVIIQLPPGDTTNIRLQALQTAGVQVSQEQVEQLRVEFGLNKPLYQQYFIWIGKVLRGDFGESFYYTATVSQVLKERIPYSIMLSFFSIVFIYIISIIGGIISALKQRSALDYSISLVSFFGLSIPEFLFALVLMYVFFKFFGISMGGFYSLEFKNAAWSFAKFVDLLKHLWAPVIVLGAVSTAFTLRVLRASMLDELRKPYVQVARSKGIPEARLILKYPTRVALNPVISTIGYILPTVISGEMIIAYVMNLPTLGPALLNAALTQDMYLVGAIVMILSAFTVFGTLVSDLLLIFTDPRIKY